MDTKTTRFRRNVQLCRRRGACALHCGISAQRVCTCRKVVGRSSPYRECRSRRASFHIRHVFGLSLSTLVACVYGGLLDSDSKLRNEIVAALKEMKTPNLRWPGGCFADAYHWRDGVEPKESRPRRVNMHWGGVIEDNSFGSAEFLSLCERWAASHTS